MTPAMTEYWQPQPPVVTPGKIDKEAVSAPSDAIVLFDGKDLSQWENTKGNPAEWTVHDGVFTVKKGTGDIQTKQKFNDFQLHIEWRVPEGIQGESQARGNSGKASTPLVVLAHPIGSRVPSVPALRSLA